MFSFLTQGFSQTFSNLLTAQPTLYPSPTPIMASAPSSTAVFLLINAVADLDGPPPPPIAANFVSISCSFRGHLIKFYPTPPLRDPPLKWMGNMSPNERFLGINDSSLFTGLFVYFL